MGGSHGKGSSRGSAENHVGHVKERIRGGLEEAVSWTGPSSDPTEPVREKSSQSLAILRKKKVGVPGR